MKLGEAEDTSGKYFTGCTLSLDPKEAAVTLLQVWPVEAVIFFCTHVINADPASLQCIEIMH